MAEPIKHHIDVIPAEVISTNRDTNEYVVEGYVYRAVCDCGWSSIEHATRDKASVHGWLHVQTEAMDEET